jgi:hypothetical protein
VLSDDAIYLPQRIFIQRPADRVAHEYELIRAAGAPQRDHRTLIEDPAQGERYDTLAVSLACEGL